MRTFVLGLALLLGCFGPCQSSRNQATCALEIIGNGQAGGLKSVTLDCNGSRSVEVGIDTSIIGEQHSRHFTGVHVSPGHGCQRNASEGLQMEPFFDWIDEPVVLSTGDAWGWPKDVRLRPLMYFCGDDNLTFSNFRVMGLRLEHAAPLGLWDFTARTAPVNILPTAWTHII